MTPELFGLEFSREVLAFGSLAFVLILIALRMPIGVALGVTAFLGLTILRNERVAFSVMQQTPFELEELCTDRKEQMRKQEDFLAWQEALLAHAHARAVAVALGGGSPRSPLERGLASSAKAPTEVSEDPRELCRSRIAPVPASVTDSPPPRARDRVGAMPRRRRAGRRGEGGRQPPRQPGERVGVRARAAAAAAQ